MRNAPLPPDREHRPHIDGLRFLAFVGIFLLHCNSQRWLAGSLGVPLFFTLSGFLITRILLRHESESHAGDLRTFYARRILRIFPLYYAVLLVLMACGQLERPLLTFAHMYNYVVYANRAFIGNSGHFWTLAVEEQFYLIFPPLLLLTPPRWRSAMLWSLFAACAGSRVVLEWLAPNPYTFVLTNVAGVYLVAGAIAGQMDTTHPQIEASRSRFWGSVALSIFVILWTSGLRFGMPWLAGILPELTAFTFAVLIWELWKCRGWPAHVLGFRPLAYLGKISYGCYVLHVYAMQQVYDVHGWLHFARMPNAARPFLAMMVTIIAASASWYLFESPILSLKSRFSYNRRPISHSPKPQSETAMPQPSLA